MSTPAPQPLIGRLKPSGPARARLLFIPQAGAGTAVFRPLAATMPGVIDMCAVRLPGRENRRREPPFRMMPELVDALATALDDWTGLPLVLVGYCSGAFIAFELARHLAQTGRPAPVRLIACAAPAPQIVDRNRGVHRMPLPDLISYLREYQITPEPILTDESVFRVFEPAIRADFELFETAPYEPGCCLDLPVSVIGGRDDNGAEFSELLGWSDVTSQEFSLRMIRGGHDIVTTSHAVLSGALARELLTFM